MENTEVLVGLIAGILIATVVAGALIWVISKLKLGLEVKNFGWAMLAGLLIGFFTNIIMNVIPEFGQAGNFVVRLIVAAVVILACGKLLKGLTVNGFKGALLAALAIAVINFLILLLQGAA